VLVEHDTGNGINQVLDGPWILTNYHVIARAGLIVATARNGTKSNAWVIFFDRDRDIALIQTHIPLKFSKIVAAEETKVGNAVFAIGAPKGLGWTLSNGIVSAIRKKAGGQEVVQTSAPMSPGSSGGGLFTATGELLGITSFDVKEGQNLNFAVRITPEFLASLDQFRGKGAQVPVTIPESDWNAGYTETPSEFEPENPLATPAWHSKWERMRSWDAHTQVIETIEKRLKKVTDAMSPTDKAKQRAEWSKEAETGRPSANPVNRLEAERDQAYSFRYHEFPDDIEGWNYESARQITHEPVRENVLAIQRAIKRWPTDERVLSHLLLVILSYKGEVSPEVRNALFRHVDAVVALLPTRQEVNDLIKPFKESGHVDLYFLERNIRKLVSYIYGYPGSWLPAKLGLSDQRQEKLDDRLRQKGWLAEEEKTAPAPATKP
jgi:Trypsin-like peptidase domain